MNYIISKELFETIMNKKYDYIQIDSTFIMGHGNLGVDTVPLDTFFFKCVIYIKLQQYVVNILDRLTGLSTVTLKWGMDFDYSKEFSYKFFDNENINNLNSTLQATFDAAQWVLDKK